MAEEAAVEVREAPGRVDAAAAHRHVGGMIGRGQGEREPPGAGRHRNLARRVGASEVEAADVARQHPHAAVEVDVTDAGDALVVVPDGEAPAVGVPARALDVAIEITGEEPRAAAVALHQVEPGDLVTLVPVVEAGVGDPAAVRRDRHVAVGAVALGESADLAARRRHLVDLGVEGPIGGVGVAVGGEDQALGVGRPGEAAVVVHVAVGDLVGSAALGGQDEEVGSAALEVALTVEAVDQPVDHLDLGAPVGALGGLRHEREGRLRFVGHEGGEGEQAPVGRPGELARAVLERREARGRTRVQVEHPDLGPMVVGLARRPRDVSEALAVRRPARRARVHLRVGERPETRAVDADDPQAAAGPVGHPVEAGAHEDHPLAVGRDPRVPGPFEVEDVLEPEARRCGRGPFIRRLQAGGRGEDHRQAGGRGEGGQGAGRCKAGTGSRTKGVSHHRGSSSVGLANPTR